MMNFFKCKKVNRLRIAESIVSAIIFRIPLQFIRIRRAINAVFFPHNRVEVIHVCICKHVQSSTEWARLTDYDLNLSFGKFSTQQRDAW